MLAKRRADLDALSERLSGAVLLERRQRRVFRSALGLRARFLLAMVPWLCVPAHAWAAELEVRAEPGCATRQQVLEQVEQLLGAPLRAASDLSFVVHVEPLGERRYRVRIAARAQNGELAERVVRGASCAEVRDAAAVAIAMTIAQSEKERAQEDAVEGERGEAERHLHDELDDDDGREAEAAPVDSEPNVSDAEVALQGDTTDSVRPGLRVGLALAFDAGLLPAVAPGAQLAAQLQLGSLGLRAHGALFAPTEQAARTGPGSGEFDLAAVGGLLCYETGLQTVLVAGCAGAEAARVRGTGVGVTISRTASAWFGTLRADVGVGLPLASGLRLWVRAGAGAPLARPQFVLSRTELVHRVGSLFGRGLLEIELEL